MSDIDIEEAPLRSFRQEPIKLGSKEIFAHRIELPEELLERYQKDVEALVAPTFWEQAGKYYTVGKSLLAVLPSIIKGLVMSDLKTTVLGLAKAAIVLLVSLGVIPEVQGIEEGTKTLWEGAGVLYAGFTFLSGWFSKDKKKNPDE